MGTGNPYMAVTLQSIDCSDLWRDRTVHQSRYLLPLPIPHLILVMQVDVTLGKVPTCYLPQLFVHINLPNDP